MANVTFKDNPYEEEEHKFAPDIPAVTVMPHLHRVGHDGFLFHSSGKVTGMIAANVDDYLLVTPAALEVNFSRLRLATERGDIDIQLYEGTTTSADGSAETVMNTNRGSTITPTAVLTSAPTVSGVGTLVHTGWIPPTAVGVGQSSEGITTDTSGEEWILAPSTKYLIRITNNSGATIDYRWEILWYEPDYI